MDNMELKFGDVFLTNDGGEISYVTCDMGIETTNYTFIAQDGRIVTGPREMWMEKIKCKKGVEPRLYILVNNKLNTIYGCVQGGHAVAQYMIDNPEQTWGNNYLIYLSANTEYWDKKLTKEGVKHTVFKEPDLNYAVTAIACRDDSGLRFRELETVK